MPDDPSASLSDEQLIAWCRKMEAASNEVADHMALSRPHLARAADVESQVYRQIAERLAAQSVVEVEPGLWQVAGSVARRAEVSPPAPLTPAEELIDTLHFYLDTSGVDREQDGRTLTVLERFKLCENEWDTWVTKLHAEVAAQSQQISELQAELAATKAAWKDQTTNRLRSLAAGPSAGKTAEE